MKGLEISKKYYEEYGAAMIHEQFPEYEGIIACGLAGSGSECFGFDDELSRDHDFEPGFCIWIPEENVIGSKDAFRLERAYSKLPKEYQGLKKQLMNHIGGARHGVMRVSEFLEKKLGRKKLSLDMSDWLNIPEQSFAEIVNGEIWRDDSGLIAGIRQQLSYMPEDIRLKKLAGCLAMMGQSGCYNYPRCMGHGESGAAQLALCEFVKYAMHAIFLLNMEYMPYYKWSFRALRNLGLLGELADPFEMLISSDNSPDIYEAKRDAVDSISHEIIETLKLLELTAQSCDDLGRHADSINNMIQDNNLRNADILLAV